MTAVPIPEDLDVRFGRTAEGRKWLGNLPTRIERRLDAWNLTVDLPNGRQPANGHGAVVVPVSSARGPAVLKVSFPFAEALVEPIAMALWHGDGAAALWEVDETDCAMVLERLNGDRSLQAVPMEEAIPIWGALVRRLFIAPDARPGWDRLDTVADRAERWCDELPQEWDRLGRPFERWLLEAALEVCQVHGSVARRSSGGVLVNTDFHYMNILARLEDPTAFVAIDPQPMLGEPEFAVAPLLWNRIPDLPVSGPGQALRERSAALCESAGLEPGTAAQWAVAREVDNALQYASDKRMGDMQRSIWVASTMAERHHPGLPAAHDLKRLDDK